MRRPGASVEAAPRTKIDIFRTKGLGQERKLELMGSLELMNGVLQGWEALGWGKSSPVEEPAVVRSPELKPMVGSLLF